MTKLDDKHSMAEDFLRQVEWDANHPHDKRGRPPVRYEPKRKYKKVYPKKRSVPATTANQLAITFLFMFILGAIYVGFNLFSKSQVSISGVVMALVFLGGFFSVTRPSK
jgi:hypothetical protein